MRFILAVLLVVALIVLGLWIYVDRIEVTPKSNPTAPTSRPTVVPTPSITVHDHSSYTVDN